MKCIKYFAIIVISNVLNASWEKKGTKTYFTLQLLISVKDIMEQILKISTPYQFFSFSFFFFIKIIEIAHK